MNQRSLFGEPEKKPDEFAWRIDVFCTRWEQAYKRPYLPTGGDLGQLGTYMARLKKGAVRLQDDDRARWSDTVDRYLRDRSRYTIERSAGHSLRWLVTRGINEFRGVPRKTWEDACKAARDEHERVRDEEKRFAGTFTGLLYTDACAPPDYAREDEAQRMRVMDDCAALERKAKR